MTSDCQTTIALAQIIVRGLLLSLVSAGGMVSIYFGWRLYQSAVLSQVEGEFSGHSLKVKLSAASPGVFLAAFGAYLLFSVSQHRWEDKEIIEPPVRPSAMTMAQHLGVWRVEYPAESSPPACVCPSSQDCLMKRTVIRSWIGGTSEYTAATLKEDLASIRVSLERITPTGPDEQTLKIKATQALVRLESAADESGKRQ